MSVTKKIVGDTLNLRLFLSGGETNRFVRGMILGPTGSTLGFVPLTHSVSAIYTDNVQTMPNLTHIDIWYEIYLDSDFLNLDPSYSPIIDSFERDTFDPSRLIPDPYEVTARFLSPEIEAIVKESKGIEGSVVGTQYLSARVEQFEVRAQFKEENQITGVVTNV